MNQIYSKLYDSLELGDEFPTVIMGVINLSPESFYKGSVFQGENEIISATNKMVDNGAHILDIGARSTAPWSKTITVKEEKDRIIPALETISEVIGDEVMVSIDTQYREVAEQAYKITLKNNKNIIINDVSCLKTDPSLGDFIIEHKLPAILMASKEVPGDLCTMKEIKAEFSKTLKYLDVKGYNSDQLILDPGIGHWVEEKTYDYDLSIIKNLEQLRNLQKPILVAISRKSFIGTALNIPEPQDRLAGTLSATAIAVYNGAHIIRTHDVSKDLLDMIRMAKKIRKAN